MLAFLQAQAEFLAALGDDGGAADQDGAGQLFVHHDLHGAQHALFLALGVDHTLFLGAAGGGEDRLHDGAGGVGEGLQLLAVGVHVGDRACGHAGFHGGRRHGRRDLDHQARIERLGNQVFGAEGQFMADVGRSHHFALLGLGQLGNGVHRRDFHLVGDGGGAAVERAAEDVGEAQDVVDLVRIVGAAGSHQGVVAHLFDFVGRDFGRGVGQREDQRLVGHAAHHVLLEHAASGQAEEHVGTVDDFAQRAQRGVLHELGLVLVHQLGAALVDHAGQVGHPDVAAAHAELDQQVDAGQRGGTGAGGDDLHVLDLLADHLQAVEQGGADNDGGAVLVIVEHRDLHALAQLALDVEAVGGLDVFEVDAAEGGFHGRDDLDQTVRILFVEFDVEHVDAGELLEQHALAFHHRLAGQRADVAQAQHGGAVGDHADQVAARGVAERGCGVFHDLLAGSGHAGGVGQRQIVLVHHLLGGLDADLAGARQLVVVEGGLAQLGVAVGAAAGIAGGNISGHGWLRNDKRHGTRVACRPENGGCYMPIVGAVSCRCGVRENPRRSMRFTIVMNGART